MTDPHPAEEDAMASRTTTTTTTTAVRRPHLSDLRAFVEKCDGLPDDTYVRIDFRSLDEGGCRDVEFRVSHQHPAPEVPRS